MPRKTKEQEKETKELEGKQEIKKTKSTKVSKAASKQANKVATSKAVSKTKTKTVAAKKATADKNVEKAVKKAPAKKASATSKTVSKTKVQTKKASDEKSTKKATTTKKTTSKKTPSTKSASKKSTTKRKIVPIEYYDLPYEYNQTIVRVLAQTPTNLFIYWEISNDDRENYKKQYGENFFETTKPVLIVYNDTLNYSFETPINDFANSWYLHVNDSKCDYRVELGRRQISRNEKLNTDYIHITMSNEIESPNNKILFDKNQRMVYFRDVKTNVETKKSVSSLSFIQNMGKIYNIYDFYKKIHSDENVEDLFDFSNPSS